MTAEQLQRRFPEQVGTLRTAQKHLKALVERGLLARAPIRSLLPTFPHVYFTTRRGLKVIDDAYRRQAEKPWPGKRGEQHRPSRPYSLNHIEHELMLTWHDLAVYRMLAARSDVALARIERRCHGEMNFQQNGRRKTIEPDARYDLLHQREGRTWLDLSFVEMDCGSSSRIRWRHKLSRYDTWADSSSGARYLRSLHRAYRDWSTRQPNFRLLVIAQARRGEGDDLHRLVVLLTECLELSEAMQARIWATRYSDIRDNVDGAIWFRWRDVRRWRGDYRRQMRSAVPRMRQNFVAKQLEGMKRYTLLPPRLARLR